MQNNYHKWDCCLQSNLAFAFYICLFLYILLCPSINNDRQDTLFTHL